MVDLNIEYYWHCDTNENWSMPVKGSRDNTYVVSWNSTGHQNESVQYDYSCTCPAYKFGGGDHCKHIKRVSKDRCGWNQFIDGGSTVIKNEEPTCPECGEKAHSTGHGV